MNVIANAMRSCPEGKAHDRITRGHEHCLTHYEDIWS